MFASAEELARQLGLSRSELYARAVAEFVSRHRARDITEHLNRAYAGRTARVDAALAGMQATSLEPEEW